MSRSPNGATDSGPPPAANSLAQRPDPVAQQGQVGVALAANLLAWPALKRKAYRLDPSFAS